MSTFAYADPPYLGEGRDIYAKHHEEAARWDTLEAWAELLGQLEAGYDGWALSLHVPSLGRIVPLAPERARICAWVKPWASFRPGARLQYAWEPVLVAPIRPPLRSVSDWVSAKAATRAGLQGAKPEGFALWLFTALGTEPADEFVDVFPGSGAMTRAWERYRRQQRLELPETGRQQRKRATTLGLEAPA